MDILKTEIKDGLALLTMNRPKTFNALDRTMLEELYMATQRLSNNREVRGIIITGEGKAFSGGGDLKWIAAQGPNYAKTFYDLVGIFNKCIVNIRRMKKPWVAAINGLAAGGGLSLALACDFRVMESSAALVQAYTSKGLSMDGGGTHFLSRLVGEARALEIATFDEPIDSQKALSWGLVTKVVADGKSKEEAIDLLKDIKIPLSSFGASKTLLYDALHTPLDIQLKKEQIMLSMCGDMEEGREGIAAFIEKRPPVFYKTDKE